MIERSKCKLVGDKNGAFDKGNKFAQSSAHTDNMLDPLGDVATPFLQAGATPLHMQVHASISRSLGSGLGLLLYTVSVLFRVECCIRHIWCSSVILYNITSIPHNHHTDIYPLSPFKKINTSIYLPTYLRTGQRDSNVRCGRRNTKYGQRRS